VCGFDGSFTSGDVAIDADVRLARIAADLHTVIAPVGPVTHDGIVCRAEPRRCCSRAARPIPGWPRRRPTAATHDARETAATSWWCVVTGSEWTGQGRPRGLPGRPVAGFVRLAAAAGLPAAGVMAGGVQPRGRDGVELPCLVCGELFVARRVDRRTCSPGCARRHRAARAAARLQRMTRTCEACGRPLVNGRADKRFCSSKCRVRAHRRGRRGTPIDATTEVASCLADRAAQR
jgi:hypothetical protein